MIVTDKTRETFDKALASMKDSRFHNPTAYVQETVGGVMVFDVCSGPDNVPPYAVAVLDHFPNWVTGSKDSYEDSIAFLTGPCGF